MDDTERKRWKRNAKKAEEFLVGCLDNSDISFVQRVKAAELILARYYGRPAIEDTGGRESTSVSIDWGGHEDYAR
jgi:hypothetical protein